MKNIDVVIIGGGMVGLTTALCLAELSLSVAVVDAAPEPKALVGDYLPRVSAINHATEALLKGLDAWPESSRQAAYQGMQVWDKDSFSHIGFTAPDYGHQHLGTIVENEVIRHSVWQQAILNPNISVYPNTRMSQWAQGDQQSFITLSNGDMLTAKLVVGADGGESIVRREAGFPITHWDYDHQAIVATVSCLEPHQGVARQVFTPHGPLALLPLADANLCSIVWSQQTDMAEHLHGLTDEAFNQAISATFDMKLGLITVVTQRHLVPLKMRYAKQWAKQGAVLVGDAAHTFHPLAGLGANVGFMDAAALAEVIARSMEKGVDPFSHQALRSYERWRKAEAVKTIALMEGFKQLFDGQHPLKKLIRGLGMSGVNHLPMVKQPLVLQAMGLSGELPQRARTSQATR